MKYLDAIVAVVRRWFAVKPDPRTEQALIEFGRSFDAHLREFRALLHKQLNDPKPPK